MIAPRGLRDAAADLPPGTAPELIEHDLWRMRHGHYGPWHAAAENAGPVVLYLGACSGLEALAAVRRNPGATVLVVEPVPACRAALGGSPGLTVVATLDEALAVAGTRGIAFARVEAGFCDPATLQQLARHGVHHLCGLFRPDRIDPIALYRLSRDSARASFFWRCEDGGLAFGSDTLAAEPVEVSVVVPAYRVSAELGQCLDSLARQTLERLEVIVVDDGSPDDTGAIAAEWAARHPGRIRVLTKPNGGCASARMAGLMAARGVFVGFVDGDDWVDPRMFEELFRAAALAGAEIAQCGYAEAFADGSETRHCDAYGGDGPLGRTGLVDDVTALLTLRPTVWRRIYRRDFLLAHDIRFPEHIRRFDDLPFQFEALARARRVTVQPDAWYFYRQGRPGQDVLARDDRLFVHFDIFDWLRERVSAWADAVIERQLFRVELNTHLWALGRIEARFRAEYRRRAAVQLRRNRVHLGALACLRIAAGAGRPGIALAARAFATRPGGRDA